MNKNDQPLVKGAIEYLKEATHRIANYKIATLTKVGDYGISESNYNSKDTFNEVIEKFKELSKVDFAILSKKSIIDLQARVTEVDMALSNVLNAFGDKHARLNNIKNLEAKYDKHQDAFDYAIALNLTIALSAFANENSIEKLNKHYKDIEKKVKELDDLHDVATEKLAKGSVVNFAVIFDNEAKNHLRQSRFWLAIIAIIIFGLIFFGYKMLSADLIEVNPNIIFQQTLWKILILSSCFYALSIAVKTYKAHKHNEILNKHRSNSLQTFETFVAASDNDPQIKNAILMEAAHTIFSNQQTGYTNVDSDNDSPNKIIEIFKSNSQNSN